MNWLRKIAFFTAFIIPTLTILGFYLGGIAIILPIVFVYVAIPLIDLISGKDKQNVIKEAVNQVANDFYYRFVTYCWTYFQVVFVIWGAWVTSVHQLTIF
ncbi:MAG: alkane 1-monooxygenase, partial [Marivirga sp.]